MLGEHEAEFAWASCCPSFSETKGWEAKGQRRKAKRSQLHGHGLQGRYRLSRRPRLVRLR